MRSSFQLVIRFFHTAANEYVYQNCPLDYFLHCKFAAAVALLGYMHIG